MGLLARGELLVSDTDPVHLKVLACQQLVAHLRYDRRAEAARKARQRRTSAASGGAESVYSAGDEGDVGGRERAASVSAGASVAEFVAQGAAVAAAPRAILPLDAVALGLYLTMHLDAVLRVPLSVDVVRRRREEEARRFRVRALLVQSPSGAWGLIGTSADDNAVNMVKPVHFPSLWDVVAELALELEAQPGEPLVVESLGFGAPVHHLAREASAVKWRKAVVDVSQLGWRSAALAVDKYEAKLRLVALTVKTENDVRARMDERARAAVLNMWANPERAREMDNYVWAPRGRPAFCTQVGHGLRRSQAQAIQRHERVHEAVKPSLGLVGESAEVQEAYAWSREQIRDLGRLFVREPQVDAAVAAAAAGLPNEKAVVKRLTTEASRKAMKVTAAALRTERMSQAEHELMRLKAELPLESERRAEHNVLVAETSSALAKFGNSVPGQPNEYDMDVARAFDAASLRYEPHELLSAVRLTEFAAVHSQSS
ncbi:uncharacterized protein AMSG_04095 [Thecamonas trahens ATCC 50062]|uniref:Uncharacterized protein n=1 Tax=Thecamonas trahens ATCC 50062 TaxID=461836 RepID=A0A0L0D6P0_THETB|nr:hypothetical protein AMSG_04095 [Thecamonas trahens ATCC 50062]KNC47865.1 hypothetical protein AMSG_04095 [Thecamonas trahens ATCC 50062]|eukprot:XP_013759343.1 hypothetical protein AMSG_04095 [Thecamonas trahens ATCC 50062]